MTKKDYVLLAKIVGETLAAARRHGGEDGRTAVYEALYVPLTEACKADNPRFDTTRFAYAVGLAESASLG